MINLVDAITTSTVLILHLIMRENKMDDNTVEDKYVDLYIHTNLK